MPFSSSPSLDDGSGMDGNPGTAIGGTSQDAHRQQQLEALQAAKRKEEAEVAVLANAKARSEHREKQLVQERVAAKTRQDILQREKTQSYGCYCVTVFVIATLMYLTFDAIRRRRTNGRT
jgi:hypothetical protein